jgi:hypothetical protein
MSLVARNEGSTTRVSHASDSNVSLDPLASLAKGRSAMAQRPTVQHLWNRFMAAVLFVLGTALSTAAPTESQETRVSRAEATQLEAAAYVVRQLSTALAIRLDGDGNDGADGQPAYAPSAFSLADRAGRRASPISSQPAWAPHRPARDGDSRAPPSA